MNMKEKLKSGKVAFVVVLLISYSSLLASATSPRIEVMAPGKQEEIGRMAAICNDKSALAKSGKGTLNMGGIGCSGREDDCPTSPINF